MVLISWLDLNFTSTETFWKESLAQEKSKSADFATFNKIVGKISNVFGDQIV